MALTSSPFGHAIQEFDNFPPTTKTSELLQHLTSEAKPFGPEDVQGAALRLEEMHSNSTSAKVWKFLEHIIQALRDYTGVVDTLCQAYPMPSSIVWGLLKAVIECSNRYIEIYGMIETQLSQLNILLRRLKDYEDLFGKSPDMFDLLKESYIKILKFWAVVEQECISKGRWKKAFRALSSSSERRLQSILSSIAQDTTNIAELREILQERSRRDDSETIRKTYSEVLGFKAELKLQGQAQAQYRKEDQIREARNTMRGMLQEFNEHQDRKIQSVKFKEESCSWLLSNRTFSDWFRDSEIPEIWVKGAPGTGKSTLCAYATKKAREHFPHCGVVSHYFTFDDPLPMATIYRGIAYELARPIFDEDEIPEHILKHIQRTSGSPEELEQLIEMLTEELPSVLVFLDGLDEVDDKGGQAWNSARRVVEYFQRLASKDNARVRLWLSCQDQKRVREIAANLCTLHVTQADNGRAIEAYLSHRLSSILLEVDEGSKNLVLKDLSDQAHGNFLWVHLMVETLKDCPTLEDVQREIHRGLPRNHEDYYKRKMEKLRNSEHKEKASQILSCIAFAKRSLSITELCEAVGMCQTSFGEDLPSRRTLFAEFVLRLCSPMVEVNEIGDNSTREVYGLFHSSVKKFLVANPNILDERGSSSDGGQPDCQISEEKIAEICLKYLMQKRFTQLLVRKDEKIFTSDGVDTSELHFLTYAAKYWDKHYDEVGYGPERFKRVENFIQSKNFRTCIQVQSLFVQGQFRPWRARRDSRELDVLGWRRAFPHWFIKDNGVRLNTDYYTFVREWAPFLNEVTCNSGPHPGDIDRCLWGALPTNNFLYEFGRKERVLRSFMLPPDGHDDCAESCRYFENVDRSGNEVQVMRLQKSRSDSSYQLLCERWNLNGHRPRSSPQLQQVLTIDRKAFELYDKPLWKLVIGRPAPVQCTPDFHYLRLASSVFIQSTSGDYQKLPGLESVEERPSAVEEIASNGRYLAISTRSRVLKQNLWMTGLTDTTFEEIDVEKFFNMIVSAPGTDQSTESSSSERKSRGGSTGYGESETSNSSQTSISSMPSYTHEDESPKGLGEDIDALFQIQSEEEDWEVESNSAEEFWSDGSTDHLSDETDDADLWNDWASVEENIDFEKEWDKNSEASLKIEGDVPEDSDPEDFGLTKRASHASSPSLDSSFSESFLGSSVSGSSESERNEGGARLDELLWGNQNSSRNSNDPVARVEVFDTETGKANLVFHFTERIQKTLYSSPPLFHPSKPLMVWPIGGGELLFADYRANKYFTRTLRSSAPHTCHIFVKGQFSDCGEYLHLASLEARQAEPLPGQSLPPLKTFLQVSTHRLSSHKTTRSPPRLVYRTVVPLGESQSLPVSMMPYTLTWRKEHVYLSINGSQLDVLRVPLFSSSPSSSGRATAKTDCLVLKEKLWLPHSALFRPIYFFPPEPTAKKRKGQVTVILGSSRGDAVLVSRKLVSSPSGVFFDGSKLGAEWKEKEGMGKGENAKLEKLGARLVGKFESFDLKDDCDIVPYLT